MAVFAILAALFTECKKEDNGCDSCPLILANSGAYNYKVSFEGWSGAPGQFVMEPGEIEVYDIPAGVSVTVNGDYQSPYAHNDFSKSYRCDGECGAVNVILRE